MRVMTYFQDGEAKDDHSEKFSMVENDSDGYWPGGSDQGNWPQVVHEMWGRFLTDDVLLHASM